jgi:hypothetical protein
MPDSDTTTADTATEGAVLEDTEHEPATTEAVREEPVEVTAEVVRPDDVDDQPIRTLAIRHVLERQLVVGNALGVQLVDAATDVSAAVAHTPASVVDEIRGGATLPTALANTGTSLRGVVYDVGSRVRTAVGGYVGAQAALPNAVVVGTADVAESLVRAQGTVTASALNAAFTVASTATQGGDVREVFGRERVEVGAAVGAARQRVEESLSRAREELRTATQHDG